jgi:hypothetical protein
MSLRSDEDGNGGDDAADGVGYPRPPPVRCPKRGRSLCELRSQACHEMDAPNESFASRIVMFALPGRDEDTQCPHQEIEGVVKASGISLTGLGRKLRLSTGCVYKGKPGSK